MKQTLQEMNEEFLTNVLDFQTDLLALDCLKHCETCPVCRMEYPEEVFVEYRNILYDYVEQHAEGLSQLAVYIANRCTVRERELLLFRKNGPQS